MNKYILVAFLDYNWWSQEILSVGGESQEEGRFLKIKKIAISAQFEKE